VNTRYPSLLITEVYHLFSLQEAKQEIPPFLETVAREQSFNSGIRGGRGRGRGRGGTTDVRRQQGGGYGGGRANGGYGGGNGGGFSVQGGGGGGVNYVNASSGNGGPNSWW
jgi:ATP-dependent RNA helicase DDX3X